MVIPETSANVMTNIMNPQTPSSQASAITSPNPLIGSQQPAPMPQMILTSGHLIQGIQGAQLLIPTSQGKPIFYKQSISM